MTKEKFEFQKLELPTFKKSTDSKEKTNNLAEAPVIQTPLKEEKEEVNEAKVSKSEPFIEVPKQKSAHLVAQALREENNKASKNEPLVVPKQKFTQWLMYLFGFLTAMVVAYSYMNLSQPIREAKAQKIIPIAPPQKDTVRTDTLPKNEIAPKYINYHDSIVFLNDVKGEKKVVSKGYDDYLQRNKIIIKSGNFYFNCFCDDLFKNYQIGDIIP
jgi:hypothetical protein